MTTEPANISGTSGRWNQFWFASAGGETIGLLRALVGIALFQTMTRLYGLYRINEPVFEFPNRQVFEVWHMVDRWHMPYPGLGWLPVPSQWMQMRIEELLLLGSILLILGLFTRVTTIVVAAMFSYMMLVSQFNYHHHRFALMIVLIILAFSRTGNGFSLDRLWRRKDAGEITVMPLRLVQVLVTCIYLFGGLAKCTGGWLSGETVRVLYETHHFHGLGRVIVGALPFQVTGIFVVAAELFLAVGLWWRPTRMATLWIGVMLHLGIDSAVKAGSFSYIMMAMYAAWIEPACGATVTFYDGRCGLCQGSKRLAGWLDWFGRVSWLDFRDSEVRSLVPFLSDDSLEQRMHVITPEGRILVGYDGWRRMIASFPLTFIPSVLLYVFPVSFIGRRVYNWVAANRKLKECRLPGPGVASQGSDVWRRTIKRAGRPVA